MRIVLAYNQYIPAIGGIERLMHTFATKMVHRGHEVYVLTCMDMRLQRGHLPPEENIDGVHIIRVSIMPQLFRYMFCPTPSAMPRVFGKIKAISPDIVHWYSLLPSVFMILVSLAARLYRFPLAWSTIYHPRRRSTYSLRQRLISTWLEESVYPRLLMLTRAQLIALTSDEAFFFRRRGIRSTYVVPEIVTRRATCGSDQELVLTKFGLRGKKIALCVGRLAWYKGIDVLLSAWARIEERVRQAFLVVVGPDAGELRRLIGLTCCCERVLFTGPVSDDDLDALYEVAQVVVSPSKFETFMRIALEAWLHRKPLICFDLGAATDFVASGGWIVPLGNVQQLSEALGKALTDESLSRRMGELGWRELERSYAPDHVCGLLESVYRIAAKDCGEQVDMRSRCHNYG